MTSHVIGQYIYGLPLGGEAGSNTQIIRIDTANDDAVSYIDTKVSGYEAGSRRFLTSHVIGQYIYGLPFGTAGSNTQIIRIDTAKRDSDIIQ